MESFAFEEGVRILLDKKRYRLLNEIAIEGIPHWQMVPVNAVSLHGPTRGAVIERQRTSDLETWFANGTVEFDLERDEDTPEQTAKRTKRRSTLLSDKPDHVRKRIEFRRDIIREVERRLPPGLKTSRMVVNGEKTKETILARTLMELGKELGQKHYGQDKEVSTATYYRWKGKLDVANDVRDLEGDFDKRGYRRVVFKKVKAIIRKVMMEKLEAAREKSKGDKPTVTMTDIMIESLTRLDALKVSEPELAEYIKLPCKSTFYNILDDIPAYLASLALRGRTKTQKDFRGPRGHEEPAACLSDVQYDETLLDVYSFDDLLGIPLGRPWLAWLVDVYSKAIIGFYCGFEPPGDLVFTSVFRHASLPKSYVRQAYPDIASDYIMGGLPRFVTFDNELAAHGRTIERLMNDLDIAYDFTPPRMPWVKGVVENTFRVLNQTLLREMPGFVLSKEIDPCDYNPAENGCIGFSHLLWIIHKWIVEVYNTGALPRLNMSPNQRWIEGTRIIKPRFPRVGTDLDFLCGIDREGSLLDSRGVLYANLRYYSDGVDILRRNQGASLKVRVRVNPLNIGKVHVYDSKSETWIPCYALDQKYASGLDLHRHILYTRHAERISGSTDLEARLRAKMALHDLIKQAVPQAMGMRTNTLIARAAGIGTHTIFNLLNPEGHFGALNPHFAVGTPPLIDASNDHEAPLIQHEIPSSSAVVPIQRRLTPPRFTATRSLRPRD
ncbi:Mu transposase C-terminal domain-containing protein [Microvirga arabica]|uniref:Mu transposase C-terminal domain-containing protein n=1 Tax=Microvirga arabica TaxID=1128671 RepID=UPI00193AA8ED|nr:Mu transposase C-terminal domain-containing protein [Microvirga arabica]MBM1170606.1 DDE-type integrase/transposase/recombinase [Microvirga arabica]